MLPLESLDIGIHTPQLLFDNHQTFGNKLRGIDRNPVLILNGILIVNGNQGIQHILRTRNRNVRKAQVDNGRIFCRQIRNQGPLIAGSYSLQIGLTHLDLPIIIGIGIVKAGLDHHPANRCLYRIVQSYILGLFHLNPLACAIGRNKVEKTDLLFRKRHDRQRERLRFSGIRERKSDRRLAVKLYRPQTALLGIADVQTQPPRHHLHQPVGLKDNHLVVYIARDSQHIVQVGKAIRRHCPAAAPFILDQDRCRTGIDTGCLEQVNIRCSEAHYD